MWNKDEESRETKTKEPKWSWKAKQQQQKQKTPTEWTNWWHLINEKRIRIIIMDIYFSFRRILRDLQTRAMLCRLEWNGLSWRKNKKKTKKKDEKIKRKIITSTSIRQRQICAMCLCVSFEFVAVRFIYINVQMNRRKRQLFQRVSHSQRRYIGICVLMCVVCSAFVHKRKVRNQPHHIASHRIARPSGWHKFTVCFCAN